MNLRNRSGKLWRRFRSLPICLAATTLAAVFASTGTALRGAELPHAPGLTGRSLPFAVADFDGDHQPDLASIEAGKANSSSDSEYWIQLHLSKNGLRWIRLVAPLGGLMIEARDVNGDHAIDLVLATAWLHQPVAVLLNDGRGGFSRAAPRAFPSSFDDARHHLLRLPWTLATVATFPEPLSGIPQPTVNEAAIRAQVDDPRTDFLAVALKSFACCNEGRAPPSDNTLP